MCSSQGLLRQDGVCLARVHDLHQHVQRATVHAEGDRECRGLLYVALQLGLLDAAPPDLMHRQEAAGSLVDVELFRTLGGLLVAQAHAVQELSDPPASVTRMMCSLSRVMLAGDSKVFLPSGAARGTLHFQRYGVFGLIPSNILGTSAKPQPNTAACPIAAPSSTGGICR